MNVRPSGPSLCKFLNDIRVQCSKSSSTSFFSMYANKIQPTFVISYDDVTSICCYNLRREIGFKVLFLL